MPANFFTLIQQQVLPNNPLYPRDRVLFLDLDNNLKTLDRFGNVQILAGGGTATLNFNEFGAKGDGIHDDSDAFGRLIDRINSLESAIVMIPPGTYKITQPFAINAQSGVVFIGTDPIRSVFYYEGTGTFLTVQASSEVWGSQIRIQDVGFKGNSTSPWNGTSGHDNTSIGILLALTRQGGLLLDNCIFENFGMAGVQTNDVTFNEFHHTLFTGCKRGFAGGYKTDLLTMENCFFFQCDIGCDLGFWDPNGVPGGVTVPFGPTTVNFISCGATQNRIGIVVGGININGVVFHGWYGEFNTQCMFMVGHAATETWFSDGTRNTSQKQDVADEFFGTRIIWNGCHSLSNEANIHVYRYGQYFIQSFTGSGDDATDAVLEFKTAFSDQSRLEIRDSWSPGVKYSDNSTVATLPEGDYPLQPVVIAVANNATSLGNGAYTEITLDAEILDTHGIFAANVVTCPQSGVIEVSGYIYGSVVSAGQQIALFINKNGTQDVRMDGRTGAASALGLNPGGTITMTVSKGDTIGLKAYQDSGAPLNTFAPATRFEFKYIRGPNNTPL